MSDHYIPDAPEAPPGWNSAEASAWESGWSSGFTAACNDLIKVGVLQDGVLSMAPARKKWLSEKQDKEWRIWWENHDYLDVVYLKGSK